MYIQIVLFETSVALTASSIDTVIVLYESLVVLADASIITPLDVEMFLSETSLDDILSASSVIPADLRLCVTKGRPVLISIIMILSY